MKKLYLLSLGLVFCFAQSMWRITATLPQDNGQPRVVEFDIDSSIAVREITHLFRISYSEPTTENIHAAQNAHRDTCRELNQEYTPLSVQEAKKLYEKVLGEQMLDAIKTHQPQLYPMIIGILAGKTGVNQFRPGA